MPEIALAKINPEAPLEGAALFACGLSTGLGAAMNTAKVEAGSTCVVFGAGMVGLGAVIGCRLQGAERIVCVDLSEDRLELATQHGATETMVGGPDTVEQILESTGGFGADYTFEATGNVDVMRQAVESARMGWGLCTVAGVAGKGETLDIVPRYLITGRRVAGSSFGGVKGRDGVPLLVERWLAGDIDVESFISHRITLDEVNRGFELMEAQDGIRSVIAVLMILERAEHPEWTSNAYLVADGDGGHGVLVDSNGVEEPLLAPDRAARDHDHARARHPPARRPRRRRDRAREALRRQGRRQRADAATRACRSTRRSPTATSIRSGELEIRGDRDARPLPRPLRAARRTAPTA